MARVLLTLVLLWAAVPAQALEWGPYLARYVRAYDGDTVTLQILIWPDLRKIENVRLEGVDTPEIRSQCDREKRKALEARDFVRDKLSESTVTVTISGFDKYGRALGRVSVNGEDLGQMLLDQGHAREYDGGQRQGWCGVEG